MELNFLLGVNGELNFYWVLMGESSYTKSKSQNDKFHKKNNQGNMKTKDLFYDLDET